MRQKHTSGYNSGAVESRILRAMEKLGRCTLGELIQTFPAYIREHLFIAVERLNQDCALILRHPTQFTCVVEVGRGYVRASRPISRA
jgi:hypothetical protein